MNKQSSTRLTNAGRFMVAVSLALVVNVAVGAALIHAPTKGQRYLADSSSGETHRYAHVAMFNCLKGQV